METEKTTASFLPNPEFKRHPIVTQCDGCQKVYENHILPEGEVLVDVCICYEDPKVHWRNYRVETEKGKVKGKEVDLFYHYSPCAMATHIKHSPKIINKVRDRVKRK
jgi:hypothetical protein